MFMTASNKLIIDIGRIPSYGVNAKSQNNNSWTILHFYVDHIYIYIYIIERAARRSLFGEK